jgi:hypothetical protein
MDVDDLFGSDESDEEEVNDSRLTKAAMLVDESGKRRTRHPYARVDLWGPGKSGPLPKYVGPIILERELGGDVGGGRGFVAACPIAPGTLILAEAAVVKWSDLGIADGSRMGDVPFEVRVLQEVLANPNSNPNDTNGNNNINTAAAANPPVCAPATFVAACEQLYPNPLSEFADPSLVVELMANAVHAGLLSELAVTRRRSACKQPPKSSSPGVVIEEEDGSLQLNEEEELLRLVLALRSNAFASGVRNSLQGDADDLW